MSWDPQILVFACNWCSYGGADAAGVSRFQYPPDVQIVRVMCSGRADPGFVLRAFNKGADGVLVTGCHLGDCHYQDGNYKAEKRVEMLFTLLSQLGFLERFQRLKIIFMQEQKESLYLRQVKTICLPMLWA